MTKIVLYVRKLTAISCIGNVAWVNQERKFGRIDYGNLQLVYSTLLIPPKYIVLRGIFLLYYLYYIKKLIKAYKNEPCRVRLIKTNFERMKRINVGYERLDDSQEVFIV